MTQTQPTHTFVVTDEGGHITGRVECSDPATCEGWIECMLEHDDLPVFDEEIDPDERYISHGVEHWYELGMWAIDYDGCVVEHFANNWGEWADGVPERVGRYEVNVEWSDFGSVWLSAKDAA